MNVSLNVRGSEYWLCLMVEHFFSTSSSAHISNFISENACNCLLFKLITIGGKLHFGRKLEGESRTILDFKIAS